MAREEEKKPMISVGAVYQNYVNCNKPVDEVVMLEAYIIASTLFAWSLRAEGLFCWLIDYIKVTFCSTSADGIIVNFRLTLKPLLNPPSTHIIEVIWNKSKHYETLESPRYDTVDNCVSKGQVIDGIKNILHEFIVRLSKEKTKEGQYLEKLSQTIKEKM